MSFTKLNGKTIELEYKLGGSQSTGPRGYRFESREQLQDAVNQWCQEPRPTSAQQYGHISTWDVSQITDMSSLFKNKTNFNDDISEWVVSSVTDMSGMFRDAFSFNQPLNSWDVSSVNNMRFMFYEASSFNQPLDSWDVSSVTDMSWMFERASSFNQPLDSWDVSSVTVMRWMFVHASSFNQPLDSWNVSSVTNMWGMFSYASSFNQPLDSWDVPSVTDMRYMFQNASSFNQQLNSWTLHADANTYSMFENATAFTYDPPQPGQVGVRPRQSETGVIQRLPVSYEQIHFGSFTPGEIITPRINIDIREQPNSDIALLSGNEIRKILKNYDSSGEHIIRLSDFNIGNKLTINFYKQLHNNLHDFSNFKKVWIVKYDNTHSLDDNDDVGGYSKALFSHFAKYCLFYDKKLYDKKQDELKDKLNKLKDDYKKICETKAYLLNPGTGLGVTSVGEISDKLEGYNYLKNINIQNPFLKLELETYCKRLDLLNQINLDNISDDIIYHYLKNDLDDIEKGRFRVSETQKRLWDRKSAKGTSEALKVKKKKLNRLEIATVPIWWKKIKKIVIKEHDKLLEDEQNLEKEIKNLNFLPFVIKSEGTLEAGYSEYLKINEKLDKDVISSVFGNINIFYIFVGTMFGKYITQELPVWRGRGIVQYARNYIPIGYFLLLLILNEPLSLNKNNIYDALIIDHKISKEKVIERLYLYNKYGNNDIPAAPTFPSQDEMSSFFKRMEISKFIKNCYYFYINKEDDIDYLEWFLNGTSMMIKRNTGIKPEQLTKVALECLIGKEKIKLLELLEKEKVKFSDIKLGRLNIFIDIVNELDVDQLKELLIFFTGLSCSPDNIRIEFSPYNSFFKGHLCSNGLEIPLTSGYKSSPIEQYDTKEKLKTALLNSLAFKQ